jgi:hypothetical protein
MDKSSTREGISQGDVYASKLPSAFKCAYVLVHIATLMHMLHTGRGEPAGP